LKKGGGKRKAGGREADYSLKQVRVERRNFEKAVSKTAHEG